MTTRSLSSDSSSPVLSTDASIPAAGRFDALWTAVPVAALVYLAALASGGPVVRSRVAVASILFLAAFGGMLLGLGVLWVNELRLAPRRERISPFGSTLAGGILAATLAALLLPHQAEYRMGEIGPWIFLSAVVMLLLLAMLKEGTFDPAGILGWIGGDAARPRAEIVRDYVSMMKFGLNSLVLATALVGFVMASPANVDWLRCFWMMIGTACVAGGASALNQVCEIAPDALMRRTAVRPLPAGRLHPAHALTFAVFVSLAGLLILGFAVSLTAAATAALTLATYVFLYTPLKRINTLSTLAGAVAGALPPLLGWVAAGRGLGLGGLLLFFILFFWQIPHFLAISWKYRDQYARGGFPMFSVLDPTGRAVGFQSLLHGAALLVVALLCWRLGMAGQVYAIGAGILGAALLVCGMIFFRRPAPATARNLFFATLVYLPALMLLMTLDRILPPG